MPASQGLYIHIPFCARRCPYCDFSIAVGKKDDFKEQYIRAITRELEATAKSTLDKSTFITTINLGGGTPTALEASQLRHLMETVRHIFTVSDDAEISIEGNPELLELEKLQTLRAAGWNRLSLGAQSFDNDVLRRLGRVHDAARIEATFEEARVAGFRNINLDLIYGVPGQGAQSWRETLHRAVALQPDHVSCYALTIEAQTPFANWIEQGRMPDVDDGEAAFMMEEAASYLGDAGYRRYEVSNWARPGFECRHNLDIWRGGNYLAAGCGAHGHYEGHRWWNERDATKYVKIMERRNDAIAGDEHLTPPQRATELVALGLRLAEGFRWQNLERLQVSKEDIFEASLETLISEKLLLCDETALRIHPDHVAVTDAIARKILR